MLLKFFYPDYFFLTTKTLIMNKLIAFAIAAIFLFGCGKDEETNPTTDNYFPLTTGSYWVYANYKIDSNGVETSLNHSDTIIITGDSIVGNKTFKVFLNTTTKTTALYRDSSGSIVNQHGQNILPSALNNSVLFIDTFDVKGQILYIGKFSNQANLSSITVPAGTFQSRNTKSEFNLNYYDQNGLLTDTAMITDFTYYANNVGKIQNSYSFYSIPKIKYVEKLIAYHIQ